MAKINIQFCLRKRIKHHTNSAAKDSIEDYRPMEVSGRGFIHEYGVRIILRPGYYRIYPWHTIEDVEVWEDCQRSARNIATEEESEVVAAKMNAIRAQSPRAEAAKNEPEDKLDAAQETGKWAMEQLGKTVFGDVER